MAYSSPMDPVIPPPCKRQLSISVRLFKRHGYPFLVSVLDISCWHVLLVPRRKR